jgi:ketosteroid isomerase-like protein
LRYGLAGGFLLFSLAVLKAADTPSAEEQIYTTIKFYVADFSAGDADRVAEHWSEQGEYLSRTTRQRIVGRENIPTAFAKKFEQDQPPRLEVDVASIRFANQDLGLEEGIARIFQGGCRSPRVVVCV